MVLFVVVPFIMILLYFNYMLTNSMVWSISEKTISLTSDGALVLEFENPKLRTVKVNKGEVKKIHTHKRKILLQIESCFKSEAEKQTLLSSII